MVKTVSGKTKVTHIITSLDIGGAEMMLYRLLEHIDRDRFESRVISLVQMGVVGARIRALGIPVQSLEMRPGRPSLRALSQLIRILRQECPNIIHTWMYHADLLGGLTGFLTGTPVIWGIHNTSLDPAVVKTGTMRVVQINARLSKWIPRRIIVCSNDARNQHTRIGYSSKIFVTIPNGFDLDIFSPNAAAYSSLRRELNIGQDDFLIGLVARFDPLKDHQTFIKAADLFLNKHPQTHFLLCGGGISWQNENLKIWINSAGTPSNFHLLGPRNDIPYIMNGLDINTLSSLAEAFPNVIGEAMACGIPCVATNVGDTAYLIGDTGISVPPKEPQALAEGWGQLLSMSPEERHALGERARQRIQQNFGITQIAQRYEALYEQIVEGEK
jgi:glycosyltransferase involved in cell wall biosynthesis